MSAARQADAPEAPKRPIRVVIVDDAVVVRGLLARWLHEDGGVEVIATHRNGSEALASDHRPDVIVLDIDMPDMDGITALPLLIKKWPNAAIIMSSTLTTRNAETTLICLSMGAHDYVTKPSTNRDVTFSTDFRREIVSKVMVLGQRTNNKPIARVDSRTSPLPVPLSPRPYPQRPVSSPPIIASVSGARETSSGAGEAQSYPLRPMPNAAPKLLMIGASTGGPKVIVEFLQAARAAVQAFPVVIVQHMPAMFTQSFAENIRKQLAMDSSEAQHGEILERGRIYVAPGGRHLKIERSHAINSIALDDSPPLNFFRPSVDIAFQSAALSYGPGVLAVMLTGMGTDGLAGSTEIVGRGGSLLAQDEASSIVWGMPGTVVRHALCSAVAPVGELASIVTRLAYRGQK